MIIFLRKALLTDIDNIMLVIDNAKELLKQDGSSQWQNGEPSRQTFINDIKRGECYVLTVEGKVAGVTTVYEKPDANYETIHEGQWQSNEPYATLHRVAISSNYRGQHLSDILFTSLFSLIYSKGFRFVRLDTHRKNKRVQHIAEKWGFQYRGLITTDKKADAVDRERLAYELELN